MRAILRKCKRIILRVKTFQMTKAGYSKKGAKIWLRRAYHDLRRNRIVPFSQRVWAYRHGFTSSYMMRFGITRENYRNFIGERDYYFAYPLNGKYNKWINDSVSLQNVFEPYKEYLPKAYYHLFRRDGETLAVPMDGCPEGYGDTTDEVLRLIQDKGEVMMVPSGGVKYLRRRARVKYRDGMYYYGAAERKLNGKALLKKFSKKPFSLMLIEVIEPNEPFCQLLDDTDAMVRLIIFNELGDNPVIGQASINISFDRNLVKEQDADVPEEVDKNQDGELDEELDEEEFRRKKMIIPLDLETGEFHYGRIILDRRLVDYTVHPANGQPIKGRVPHWEKIVQMIDHLCRYIPQIEYMGMDIKITPDGFKIIKVLDLPPFSKMFIMSPITNDYLKKKVAEKKASLGGFSGRVKRSAHKTKLLIRSRFAMLFYPRGLKPYLSVRWITDVWHDFKENKEETLRNKLWAYGHGFLSYRLKQYGITRENYREFISDFEYKWLRHINSKYRYWMEDKITVKYIASEFGECFPGYYYHISLKNGSNKIIPMMDCPEGYGADYEDIFRLAEEKGVLALKPDEGSHGEGFYKWSVEDGKHFLNHQEATKEQILGILQNVNNQYLVTEYIQMHPQISRIYSGAVNTIRMIVFKKDGRHAEIGNAYMRFGSKKTGAVDNMGAGGMFARIDIETGKYYDAKIIEHNSIQDCPYHPDTGVKIEGILPNWEKVKNMIIEIADGIPQLEYFGFDLALTEDGIKFPEINRFPDYPKIEKFSPQTIDYLLYKLKQKKKRYGYDVKPCRKLVHFPKR